LVDKYRDLGPNNFKLGRREGVGTYTEQDGSKYEGEWKDGKRHGKGVQVCENIKM